MGLTKNGDIIYRSFHSKCEFCEYYIHEYKCWYNDYINVMTWNESEYHKCEYFKSTIHNQNNSHYIHQDYEDKDRFPEKKFGGKYRFDKFGNRI